jgi:hypothetical protein
MAGSRPTVSKPEASKQGCQIVLGTTYLKTKKIILNTHKIHQIAINRTKWSQKYLHLPLHDTPKFTQIGIFGLKTNHLATLAGNQAATHDVFT